jgi:hypothetical protein
MASCLSRANTRPALPGINAVQHRPDGLATILFLSIIMPASVYLALVLQRFPNRAATSRDLQDVESLVARVGYPVTGEVVEQELEFGRGGFSARLAWALSTAALRLVLVNSSDMALMSCS